MPQHVALLRGINVGKAKRVAMADLRQLVERLGFTDVQTLLNSGNVVFSGPAAQAGEKISHALEDELKVSSRITVVTAKDLAKVIAGHPFPQAVREPSRYFVLFFDEPPAQAHWQALLDHEWAPEALALGARVAYLWCPRGMVESPLNKAVTKHLGPVGTARNWATVLKLQALLSAG